MPGSSGSSWWSLRWLSASLGFPAPEEEPLAAVYQLGKVPVDVVASTIFLCHVELEPIALGWSSEGAAAFVEDQLVTASFSTGVGSDDIADVRCLAIHFVVDLPSACWRSPELGSLLHDQKWIHWEVGCLARTRCHARNPCHLQSPSEAVRSYDDSGDADQMMIQLMQMRRCCSKNSVVLHTHWAGEPLLLQHRVLYWWLAHLGPQQRLGCVELFEYFPSLKDFFNFLFDHL